MSASGEARNVRGGEPASGDLLIARQGGVLRLTLNRPERRNALSRALVAELAHAFDALGSQDETRVVVLAGEGQTFCAGGDIEEFSTAARDGMAESDARGLTGLLESMTRCPAPVVAQVRGAAFGGAVGLVCAADIAIASDTARFSLSEARLGIVPAVISPFVIGALGARQARARMMLAAPFAADVALRVGLVHEVAPEAELASRTDALVGELLKSAPGSLAIIKRLPAMLGDAVDPSDAMARLLAERLASDEGQEGLRAFLEKRPAAWISRDDQR